jgi:UDP-N-acetylmuramate dehydrogenase
VNLCAFVFKNSNFNMTIKTNFNLTQYNTFGIEAHCAAFEEVTSVEALKQVLTENKLHLQILGGGSNILFVHDVYDVLFIKNSVKGFKKVENTEGGLMVEIGGGESWHNFVLWALINDLGGVENLSLIPGTVGAAPIQNIGAYGVELKDVFVKLEALNLQTLDIETFTHADCQFGYRDSVFKKELKGKYFIIKVFLQLQTKHHKLNTSYGDIQKILIEKQVEKPTIKDVSNAVISIRQSKLPDPSVLGNAGSFFKNPTIEKADFDRLIEKFPTMPYYPVESVKAGIQKPKTKIAAGWLIEQCGWKGKRLGNVGVHERQALVLVNYGKGKGLEIKQLAEQIQASILEKFGVILQTEVNML